jgi:hypothetical protein
MPPAWDGAEISHEFCGPGGEHLGRLLPGRGLYLDVDPKYVGITRRVPFVYPRTPIRRLVEILHSERGAITTYDEIINARTGGKGEDVAVSKASITTVDATYASLFRAAGAPAGVGTYTNIPGGAAPDRTNVGAWSLGLTSPISPDKKYLLTLGLTHASAVNMIILLDLLVAAGNIDANVATNQTINSTALTRYTGGAGVLMAFEVTTQLGATPANLNVNSYTNQAGATARATGAVAMTASAIVQRLQPVALGPFMQLQAGDYGVRSVETLVLSAGMGAGVLALNLYMPLAFIPGVPGNVYFERDSTIQVDGITELVSTAGGVLGCLTAYVLANGSSTGIGTYFMRTVAG